MEKVVSKRRPNFSADEISVLTESVAIHTKALFSKNNTVHGNAIRESAWLEVAAAVSAVGSGRSVEEVKKKWTCLKSDTKQKAVELKKSLSKTGGGPNDESPLSASEERIVAVIGSNCIDGIDGGVDTSSILLTKGQCIYNMTDNTYKQYDLNIEPLHLLCTKLSRQIV